MADLEVAARVLIRVPPDGRAQVLADMLKTADLADRYRKRLGRRHPHFGSGTLMSATQNYQKAARPVSLGKDMLDVLSLILNALGNTVTHQKL